MTSHESPWSRAKFRLRCHAAQGLFALLSVGCVSPAPTPPPLAARPVAPKKNYYRELPPGQFALRKITDPRQRPDLSGALNDRGRLQAATERSLHYLKKKSSRGFFPKAGISHRQVVASLEALQELLASAMSNAAVLAQLDQRFDIYTSVGCDDQGTMLFTGYYTPVFQASATRSAEFCYPLHKLPANHVKDPISGKTLGRRRADGSTDPDYPDRAALLASGALEGLELVWLRNAFEAYLVSVQGSAILELRDGGRMEVGYAGTNGHPYRSLGLALVKAGKLRREELNLRRMIEYFEENPGEFEPLAATNGRYVFFQKSSGGPYGCLNERVSSMASIATDKSIFPRGALCFLEAKLPVSPDGTYRGFVLDQDAGGAIRAPGRCDVFMGVGEAAGVLAGRTLAEGRLYYLFLKSPSPPAASE